MFKILILSITATHNIHTGWLQLTMQG